MLILPKTNTQHKGQSTMISDRNNSPQIENIHSNENLAVSKFIRFLKHIGLKEMLAQIPDHRQCVKHDHFGFAHLQTKFSFKLLRGSRMFIAKEGLC
jgi:hypothetical protein